VLAPKQRPPGPGVQVVVRLQPDPLSALDKQRPAPKAEGEEMREARLQELEGMAAALLATARQLPPGQDRHNALREVGRFRAQIGALKDADKARK
jgi:hypothetical protein